MRAELVAAVLTRDRMCILARLGFEHVCKDQWGNPHDPRDLSKLSMEHVKESLRMGKRASSDLGHMVAMCHGANVAVPSKVQREAIREYLRSVAA